MAMAGWKRQAGLEIELCCMQHEVFMAAWHVELRYGPPSMRWLRNIRVPNHT